MFIGTGARLSEVAGLATDDVDLDAGTIRVMGKGRRERVVYMGAKAIEAMDRYERARRSLADAGTGRWWLGRHGPMTASGLSQTVKDRGAAAGIPELHAHMFRHAYAHSMLAKGVQEGDLMALARDAGTLRGRHAGPTGRTRQPGASTPGMSCERRVAQATRHHRAPADGVRP